MKIKLWARYNVGFLPAKRHRKLRYREEEEYIEAEIKEVEKSSLVPAFDTGILIYSFNNRLWREATEKDIHCGEPSRPMTALEALVYSGVTYSTYFGKYEYPFKESDREQRKDVISRAEQDMDKYLVVDGILYIETSEPMYCIYTFGLGHNHAEIGTSLSVVNNYNRNISKERYFNALDYVKAVKKALDIASDRGDTDSLDYIKRLEPIKVFEEKFVKRNPQKEHCNGNEILNSFESVLNGSKNAFEAGLLVMTIAGI